MKKMENIDQAEDEKLHWKAQVLWSHREPDADITEQSPDERIVWRSKGAKGQVDAAVTFHELPPEMTRSLLVLEYHPQGCPSTPATCGGPPVLRHGTLGRGRDPERGPIGEQPGSAAA